MKKVLKISGFLAKKIIRSAKASLSFERGPCQIMEGLSFKCIPVNYPSAIVNDTYERPAQAKVWRVAVTTVEPSVIARSHAEWMLDIQLQHATTALVIGEMERYELLKQCKAYGINVPMRRHIEVKNT